MRTTRLHGLGMCALAVFATGCAQLKAPPYAADYEALDRLRATKPAAIAVATVQPTDPNDRVNNLSLRGARLVSPSGTFSRYLEDALIRDLKEVSAYDAQSKTRLDARILKNDINVAGIVTGTGFMEVEMVATRDGQQRLKKTYKANTSFESSLAGIVAIPAGQAAYSNLARALLREVYSDPQFIAAIGP
ncbi:hypothetical protein QTI66_06460 [Variovorax sp. J22R133]|uniref:hypothetical protein n=1 Tax=Variovorax brevis TaxID=3053503 RepID=UPI0025752541|nr:hypothetical protein [Variovorax sp. J22R133]MDM0111785.1 hypothetical protein [Variovorax sp. J22R133]